MRDWCVIDWNNPAAKISRHFTVKEAIWLNRWGRLATAKDGLTDHVKERICIMAVKMDMIRDFIGIPINVHRWFSSTLYNALIGGAKGSKHMCLGDWSAVDWSANVKGAHDTTDSCSILRAALLPKLKEFGIRMENHDGPWIHTDDAPVLYSRYFKP